MPQIQVTDHHVVYDNPTPNNCSRHGYFPALVELPSGDLLAMFVMGSAFEAADGTTVVSRSTDRGRTWQLEGPIHEKPTGHEFDCDAMKPVVLADGSLVAAGYRFHRTDPEQQLVNPETDGVRPGDNLIAFSEDEGKTWTPPEVIPRSRPELTELSGPLLRLRDGTLLGAGALMPPWEGGHPSGQAGVLLRSEDHGRTWDDRVRFFADPDDRYAPAEPRLCEMQPGRVVALVWVTDHVAGTGLPNHVTVSHDGGRTWSAPSDTGVPGQASNLIHWREDLLLSVHAQRTGDDIGVYVRVVDFADDRWNTLCEASVWDNAPAMKIASYASMSALRFGQPSLLRLSDDEVLATHWAIENGQGRILSHRLKVEA